MYKLQAIGGIDNQKITTGTTPERNIPLLTPDGPSSPHVDRSKGTLRRATQAAAVGSTVTGFRWGDLRCAGFASPEPEVDTGRSARGRLASSGPRTLRVLAPDCLRALQKAVDEVFVLCEHLPIDAVLVQLGERDPVTLHLFDHDLEFRLHLSRRLEVSVGEASMGYVVERTGNRAGDHGAADAIIIAGVHIIRRPPGCSAGWSL